MSCPFLRTARVRYCHGPAVRKPIVDGPSSEQGRCSSAAYRECVIYKEHSQTAEGDGLRCPLLDDTLAHYCGAAPIPKYIPFSDDGGRCGGEGYRFCESWLTMARPQAIGAERRVPEVGGVPVPPDLWYAPNHLWLHESESGACHIGIDAFFARLLGVVERISFVTMQGVHRPSAVLSLNGVDWALVFPNAMLITSANVYLRHAPSRMLADPYGAGWLFEGWDIPSETAADSTARRGLLRGDQALTWMEAELNRLDAFVQRPGGSVMSDGGRAAAGLLDDLSRDEVLQLFHEFFAPHAAWTGTK